LLESHPRARLPHMQRQGTLTERPAKTADNRGAGSPYGSSGAGEHVEVQRVRCPGAARLWALRPIHLYQRVSLLIAPMMGQRRHLLSPDVRHREEHSITPVVFLPKTRSLNLITRNSQTTQTEALSIKYLGRTLQKCPAHERERPFQQVKETCQLTQSVVLDWILGHKRILWGVFCYKGHYH